MKIFQPYKNIIASALNNDSSGILSKSFNESEQSIKMFSVKDYETYKTKLSKPDDLEIMARHMGVNTFSDQKVGQHPDFIHLKGTKEKELQHLCKPLRGVS